MRLGRQLRYWLQAVVWIALHPRYWRQLCALAWTHCDRCSCWFLSQASKRHRRWPSHCRHGGFVPGGACSRCLYWYE